MAKHWRNVLAGATSAIRCAHFANQNKGSYMGHTCEEWVQIHIRRARRAAEMFDKEQSLRGK